MTKETVKRTTRKPLHSRGPQSVSGEKDPNFHYRFVNDTGSRIQNFTEAGYELVVDQDMIVGNSNAVDITGLGSSKRVVSNDGTVSYLMRTKKEFFDEDQQAKAKRIDDLEASTKDTPGMYGSIKMT